MRTSASVFCFVVAIVLSIAPPFIDAVGEIEISDVRAEQRAPSKYLLVAKVRNNTSDARELILRAQITFYEKASPPGDVPATAVRKDMTLVIRPKDTRTLEIPIIMEGTLPTGSLRMEPTLRIRRQREWNYTG